MRQSNIEKYLVDNREPSTKDLVDSESTKKRKRSLEQQQQQQQKQPSKRKDRRLTDEKLSTKENLEAWT